MNDIFDIYSFSFSLDSAQSVIIYLSYLVCKFLNVLGGVYENKIVVVDCIDLKIKISEEIRWLFTVSTL